MGELIILCGISGSGKSTYAHSLWKENPLNTVIINRDKIRELLFGYTEETIKEYYFHKDINKLEKQVTEYEDTLIYEGLSSDKTVIIDATHLKREYLERYKYWNVETEVKFFDLDPGEAIIRDVKRHRNVGSTIISKQYLNYAKLKYQLEIKPLDFTPTPKFEWKVYSTNSKPHCVIFDIDGTLSEPCDRNIYSPSDAIKDEGVYPIIAAFEDCNADIIVCTGRNESFKEVTQQWFEDRGLLKYVKYFYFRKDKDFRPDWIVKEEMWREIDKQYNIEMLYEDRNSVVRRARALGLKVAQVKYGNY